MKQAKNAFLGKELVPFLLNHYPRVEAKAIVPAGLTARAAAAQNAVQGGMVEPAIARMVVTQKDFYRFLCCDIQNAKSRLVIYSAFLSRNRLGELQTALRSAVDRGIKVYVVTKALNDRQNTEIATYRMLEKALAGWNIRVVHKSRMHEKLVFVDETIVWTGSLNPLSFRDTQEIMERRCCREVVADYEETLRLNELLAEYDNGNPTCPWCGAEIVASEGQDEPFYWRCVKEGCYSRNIDEEPLVGDVVLCKKCHSEVEYAVRGDKATWRCKNNARHYQQVRRMHLRLPKMRKLLPSRVLHQLDERFRITPDKILTDLGRHRQPEENNNQDSFQRTLFDDLNDDTEADKGVPSALPPERDTMTPNGSGGSIADINASGKSIAHSLSIVDEPLREKILRALRVAGEPLGLPLLKLKTGVDRQILESVLRALIEEGQLAEVTASGGTRYRLIR
jgi:hypothetical protein